MHNPIVGQNDNQGIEISTVFLVDRGWFETCLFDDRRGKRRGNRSTVVASYSSREDAVIGHRAMQEKTLSELLDMLARQYANENH